MNKATYSILCIVLLLTSCNLRDKEVIDPDYFFKNDSNLSLHTVVITDKATRLTFSILTESPTQIKIDSTAYLVANNKKYPLLENTLNVIAIDSGKYSFSLEFEPLPKSTTSFDFIECEQESCIQMIGILLKGTYKDAEYKEKIPIQLVSANYSEAKMPKMEMKCGSTQVIMHLVSPLPVDSSLFKGIISVFDITTGSYTDYQSNSDSLQTFSWEYEQCSPGIVVLEIENNPIQLFVEPSKKNEFWIDVYAYFHQEPFVYTNGKLDALNRALHTRRNDRYWIDTKELYPTFAEMNVATYLDFAKQTLIDSISSIEKNTSLSPLTRSLYIESEKALYIGRVLDANAIRNISAYALNKNWETMELASYNQILAALEIIDFTSDNALYLMFKSGYHFLIYEKSQYTENLFSTPSSALYQFKEYRKQYENLLVNYNHTPENSVDYLQSPFYSELFRIKKIEQMQKSTQSVEIIDSLKKRKVYVEKTPITENENLLSNILSNYNGKVILINFWGVTCGPCMFTIEKMEPLKKTELNNEKIVFVYLTTTNWSPIDEWFKKINTIQGHHYYLTTEQWKYLNNQFHFNAIPFYVLVQKNGQFAPLKTGTDRSSSIKASILEALNK